MNDDYLWSGQGEPDPEVARMERLLARYRAPAPRPRARRAWAVAAAVAAVAAGLVVALAPVGRPAASSWRLEMGSAAERALRVGETVETGAEGEARLSASDVGEVRLEGNSRLRVLRSGGEHERLALRRGTMRALIWAPPARFVVDTPSATSVDLGCAYELTVQENGAGLLRVSAGWVAFQAGAIESFIPAGASCRTEPRRGPGLPWYDDASEAFRAAVARWDSSGGREGLDGMLAEAQPRDALTLWHLLLRTSPAGRERVSHRMATLTPGVSAAALAAGDRAAIDAAWEALGLGSLEFWRGWKRRW
jgi:hypothetical protein